MRKLLNLYLILLCFIAAPFAHGGTLEDDLMQYKPPEPVLLFGVGHNWNFEQALREAELDPAMAVALTGRPHFDRQRSLYADMIDFCHERGWYTTEQLTDFAAGLPPAFVATMQKRLSPQITDWPELDSIDYMALRGLTSTALPDLLFLGTADKVYQVLDEDALTRLEDVVDVSFFEYLAELRDCDDFARMFRGELSKLGLGNVTAGYLEFQYDRPGGTYYHAVIMLYTNAQGFGIYDPQMAPGTIRWLNDPSFPTVYPSFKANILNW